MSLLDICVFIIKLIVIENGTIFSTTDHLEGRDEGRVSQNKTAIFFFGNARYLLAGLKDGEGIWKMLPFISYKLDKEMLFLEYLMGMGVLLLILRT